MGIAIDSRGDTMNCKWIEDHECKIESPTNEKLEEHDRKLNITIYPRYHRCHDGKEDQIL